MSSINISQIIGSGRLKFAEEWSYMHAVNSKFLDVRTSKFQKRIQIDPYVIESVHLKCKCSRCNDSKGESKGAFISEKSIVFPGS